MSIRTLTFLHCILEPIHFDSDDESTDDDPKAILISRASLYNVKKRYNASGGAIVNNAAMNNKAMSTSEDIAVMSSIICCRDKNGNGMSRKEVITMLRDICSAPTLKSAENHYDYLIRKGKLQDLKRGGRVVKAQKTTTKRCCINAAQQLRWHGLIESIWEEQALLNLPAEDFMGVRAHFMLNLDETCVMASDGNLKVIADGSRKKQEKNSDDNRDSITIVRVGNAAGNAGPQIYLAKGKSLPHKQLKQIEKLGATKGSKIIMTPSAYMTDEAWANAAPSIAEGIRKMPVRIICC